jgi:hypothetical protein
LRLPGHAGFFLLKRKKKSPIREALFELRAYFFAEAIYVATAICR